MLLCGVCLCTYVTCLKFIKSLLLFCLCVVVVCFVLGFFLEGGEPIDPLLHQSVG